MLSVHTMMQDDPAWIHLPGDSEAKLSCGPLLTSTVMTVESDEEQLESPSRLELLVASA